MKINNYLKAFIIVMLSCLSLSTIQAQTISVTNVTTTPVCVGTDVTITFSTTNGTGTPTRFTNSTEYTIYLSNSTGTGYTSQGTFNTTGIVYNTNNNSVTSGITQTFTIPGASVNGTGYRISLSSSSPTFNGSGGTGSFGPFTIRALPTTANAGPDQTGTSTCGLTQVTLAANAATSGTGQWSIVNGTGGSFGNSASPTSTFSGNAGQSYTLRWTISNSPCVASTDEVNITFLTTSANPTSASANPSTVCANASVQLSVTGGSLGTGASWRWYSGSCGGTLVGTGSSITVNPSATTTYYVRAEGTCNNSNCAVVTVTVTTGTPANMPGGITGALVVCDGSTSIQYSVQPAQNAVSYSWTLPPGATIASGIDTRIITVDFPDPFTSGSICVTSINACGTPSAARCMVTQNINSYTPGSITGVSNVCTSSSGLTYTIPNVIGATNYNWTLPAGMSITAGNNSRSITVDVGPTITPGPLCVTVSSACGTSASKCINISSISSVTPGGITGVESVCPNTNNVIYSVQPVSGASTYDWVVPSNFTIVSGQGTRIITVDVGSNPTSGNVCVTAESACGSTSLARCKLINNSGSAPQAISGPAVICEGAAGVPFSASNVTGATSYNWSLPPGVTQASGSNTRFITVNVGTGYTQGNISVTATTSCGISPPVTTILREIAFATPGGITGPEVICPNTNGLVYTIQPVNGAVSYNWTVPTGMTIVSGANTKSITVNIGPNYTTGNVCVTAFANCATPSLSRCLTVNHIDLGIPANISGPSSVCPNGTGVLFSVPLLNGATSYNWTLPPGITMSNGSPVNSNTIIVDIGADFTTGSICVTASNACGTTLQRCREVTDMSRVLPGGITGSPVVCQGSTGVAYSIQPVSGAESYVWITPPGITVASGQGTRSITVDVSNNFTIGDIGVRAIAPCGIQSLIRWNTNSTSIHPAIPGNITASSSICPSTTVTFSIPTISGAHSYSWTLPQGMSFTAGNPTNLNAISVDILSGFKQGNVCVKAVSACGVTGYMKCQLFNILPSTPSAISGPVSACAGYSGLVYEISPVSGATSYSWTVPSGWTITSGSGTNSITVDVPSGFIQGQLSVHAISTCGLKGGIRILNIGNTPATPGTISGSSAVCNGNTYTFSLSAAPGVDSYNWTLPTGVSFSIGETGTGNSISVDVDNNFTGGEICVNALTSCGGISSQRCISLSTLPTAPGVITGPAAVCTGATSLVYSITPINGVSSYTWTAPGNMTIISGQGTHSVEVNVSGGFISGQMCVQSQNACGSPGASSCLSIELNPIAPATIISSTNFCPGSTRSLSVNEVSGATSYTWSLPAGLTLVYGQGTSTVIVEIGPAYLSGQVCVTANTSCGGVSTQLCQTVGLSPAGTPTAITTPSIVCPNSTVEFSIPNVVGTGSFNWDVPAGMNIIAGQGTALLIANTNAGFSSGEVCVTANSGCANAGTQYCQTFNTTPVITSNITAPASICPGQNNVVLSVTAVSGASTYNWTVPSGISITSGIGTNAITVSADPGFTSGQVTVAAVSPCGVSGAVKSINLSNTTPITGTISAPTSICANSTGLVFSVPVLTGAVSYVWNLPGDFIITSGMNTNSITVSVGPAFTSGQVCVYAVSECGQNGPSRCINVSNLPSQPGGVTGTTKGVCSQTLQYSVQPANGASTYTWAPPAGATIVSGQGTRIILVEFGSSFTSGQLTVFSSNSCGNSTVRTSSIITGAPDKPALINGPTSVCAGQPGYEFTVAPMSGATGYNWVAPTGASITNGQGTGTITVTWGSVGGNISVAATNSCGSSAFFNTNVILNCRLGTEIDAEASYSVYPVPAKEEIIIRIKTENASGYTLELYDLSGRLATSKTHLSNIGTSLFVMDVRTLQRGVYMLRIKGEDGFFATEKVILK